MKNLTNTIFIITLLMISAMVANAQYITVTIAGNGVAGFGGDNGPARVANLKGPTDVCMDAANNIYFVDAGNARIRQVSAATGAITTVAGGGSSTADGVPATSASIIGLSKMCIDGAGNLYISTSHKIRMIDAVTGNITTIAGTGVAGFSGDGGPAYAAQLSGPVGLCADAAGNIYISDVGNNRIRKITASTGLISTIAGNGNSGTAGNGGPATAASISASNSVCVDAAGNVYCANSNNIRKIASATGIITSFHTTSEINGMCTDGVTSIYYVQDSCGCQKVNLATGATTQIANNGADGYNGDGGNSNVIELNHPYGLCTDPAGNLYIADRSNNRIRKIGILKTTPSFIYGANQLITPCPGFATPVNSQMSVIQAGGAVAETWTVVTPPAIGALAGFPVTVMSGGTSSLAAPTTTTYTPNVGYTSGADSFMVQVSNGTSSDMVKVYVSITSGGTPATITGASSVCTGAAIALGASIPGGTWTSTNAHATVPLSSGSVTGATAGTDTIIYTLANPCPVSTSAVITVNSTPLAGTIVGSDTVCLGATTPYTNVEPGGVWSSTTPAKATVTAAGVVKGLVYGTGATIKYTVTGAGGCSAATTKSFFVNAPVAAITGTSIVCLASTISLGNPIPGGVWTASNGNATVSATGVVTGISTGMDTVTYTNTNVCGTGTQTKIISVDPSITVGTISGPTSVCTGGGTTHYTVSPSGSGAWSTSNTNAHMGPAGNLTAYTAGAVTLIYIVSNTCHTDTATFPIVVGGSSAGTITGPSGVCNGMSVALTESVPGGTWSATNGNASVSGSGLVTGLSVGLDTIVYTVPSTCGAVPGSVTATSVISVDALPDAGMIDGGTNVCVGATMLVTNAVAGGTWSTSGVYATISPAGIVTGVTGGTDMISYTVTNGCGTATTSRYVAVAVFPVAGTITGPNTVCPGSVISLVDAAAGGVWSASGANVSVSMAGAVTGLTPGTDTVFYSVSTVCGTASTSSVITVNPMPDAGIITAGGSTSICRGETVTLMDAVTGGIWSATNGKTSVTGTGVVTGIVPGVDTIRYTVSNACGSANAIKSIEVKDCTVTGVKVVNTGGIRVYPNPASSHLNIEWTGVNVRNADIIVTDVAGRVVLRTAFAKGADATGNLPVNLLGLNDGVYLLSITSEAVHYTAEIVVSKK